MSNRTVHAFGTYWTPEEITSGIARPGGRPTETVTMSNGQPSITDVAIAKAKEWGVSVAEADARIRRMLRKAEGAPPRDPDVAPTIDPVAAARQMSAQKGIPLAAAQCIAVKLQDAARLALAKEDAAIENDRKMRATTAALTPEQVAEAHAVVICRSSDKDMPPNVIASIVAGRLQCEGIAGADALRLAVVAVNEARGLPATPPTPAKPLGALAPDHYAAERTKARSMAVALSARGLTRPAKIAAIGMRLEREGMTRITAMQLAAVEIDEVTRHG